MLNLVLVLKGIDHVYTVYSKQQSHWTPTFLNLSVAKCETLGGEQCFVIESFDDSLGFTCTVTFD